MLKRIFKRLVRCLTGKKGIYGTFGKHNHFSRGDLVYENAEIGMNNYFSPYSLINNCKIGNYCSIGPGCKLGLGEHDISAISTYPAVGNGNSRVEPFDTNHPTVIENDVWLGANVVVKQGVHISSGAVIGAGAVVTKDVPPYAIAVGIPAGVIKYRFGDDTIEKLLNSEWFLKDKDEARKIARRLYEEAGEAQ